MRDLIGPVGLVVLAVIFIYTFWSGIQFWRGKPDGTLSMYRNDELPRVARNWWVVAPVVAPMLLLSFVGAGFLIGMQVDHEQQGPVASLVRMIGTGYFLISLGVASVLLFRPPRRLIPDWLKEDDMRVGYQPPRARVIDWFWLVVIGAPGLSIGVAAIALGVSEYLR